MSGQDLLSLAPLLALAASAVLLVVVTAVRRDHAAALLVARGGLLVALALLPAASALAPRQVGGLLILDGFTTFFTGLLAAIALAVDLLSSVTLRRGVEPPEELHLLVLLATLGGVVLTAAAHFAALLLGFETLSVSLFALIGYRRSDRRGVEAALKYLILSAASSALLAFGMALVYAALGTMALPELAALLRTGAARGPLVPAGVALMLVAIGFKLALVPFHLWTPDVYQGAPAPISALIATASKAAVFALLLRFLGGLGAGQQRGLLLGLSLLAGLSMLAGNLLALLSTNVKRLLAYSSIAHLGYLLIAFLGGGPLGLEAAAFYLTAYAVTILAAFGVVTLLSDGAGRDEATGADFEAEELEDYRALYWRRPWLAAVLTGALLSLAGIPLTAGFIGKFYVLAAGVGGAHWALVAALVVASAIGLFYYLRVVVVMFAPVGDGAPRPAFRALPLAAGLLVAGLGLLVVLLGVLPGPAQTLIRLTVAPIR